MKTVLKILLLLTVATLMMIPAILILMVPEDRPQITGHPEITFDRIKKIHRLTQDLFPEDRNRKQTWSVDISGPDLNLLLSYGIRHGLGLDTVFAEIRLPDGYLDIRTTLELPPNPAGAFVNLALMLNTGPGFPEINHVRTGRIRIPGWVARPAAAGLHRTLTGFDLYGKLADQAQALERLEVKNERLLLVYDWDPERLDSIQSAGKQVLIPRDHQERLVVYHNHLVRILTPHRNKTISLADILGPLFAFAMEQTGTIRPGAMENTALIQALALYSVNRRLTEVLDKDLQDRVTRPVKVSLTLSGRTDLAKHLLVSAGIAVSAGTRISGLMGLSKEVMDSAGGSGFSFADLAADKAGIRLGEMASRSFESAMELQRRMSAARKESDFMPDISGLPEGIRELEFRKRYTDLDSTAYALVEAEIQNRIQACPVFRP